MNLSKYKTIIADAGLVYAAAIWGSTFFIVKDSLDNIDPVILVGYRFLLAASVMAVFLLFKKKNLFVNIKQGAILGLFLWLLYAPQTLGLKFTSSSNSVFITGLFVAFVPLFSYLFFKKLPNKNKLFAVIISLLGLWFLTSGSTEINKGDLLTIITAMAYAIHILFADKYVKNNIDPYVLSFQQFFVVGLLSIIVGWVFNLPFSIGSTSVAWVIVFLALLPTLSAFVIQLVAQKFTSPVKVALIFALEPVFGAIFSWTLGGEKFILTGAIGGLLIVAGMIISELPSKQTQFLSNQSN